MRPYRLSDGFRHMLICLALISVIVLLVFPVLAPRISHREEGLVSPAELDVRPIPVPTPPMVENALPVLSTASPAFANESSPRPIPVPTVPL